MPAYLKCTCEHCGGRIEYPADAVGGNAPCPHCQQDTPLKLDGGDDAGGVEVGGGKAKLVIATVVGCLIAVAALVAAGAWVKKTRGGKAGSSSAPASSIGTSAAPSGNPMTKVELDPPKTVVPVIGKFQNGLSAAQIKSGREIIGGACTDCHRQYDPATYANEEWNRIIGTMRGKAKLKGRQSDELDTFVRSVRN